VLLLQRVSLWFLGGSLRRPVQGRAACDLVEGGVPGSEVPGSKVIGSNVVVSNLVVSNLVVSRVVVSEILGRRVLVGEVAVGSRIAAIEILGGEVIGGEVIGALKVGFFDEVGSVGVPGVRWRLAGEIGCGELLLVFAHHCASWL
jgi:hypothetical protein